MNRRIPMPLVLTPLMALLACGGSSTGQAPSLPPTASTNMAQFAPSAGIVPLPNILATATAAPVDPRPGVPLSPSEALAFVNQREVGGTHAVSGLTSPILVTFDQPIQFSSVTPQTLKVFRILPDAAGTENQPLGFQDVSALFDAEPVVNAFGLAGAGVQLHPKLPLLPGNRYVYVVTDGVKDQATQLPVIGSLFFDVLKYVKPGGSSATTSLADLTDPNNPAAWMGAAAAGQLEQIRGNVLSGGQVLLSGYGKTLDDLIASAAADTSGKAALGASATGIKARTNIALMGRFITSGAMATQTVLGNSATQVPVEVALWAWANNAATPPFAFGAATGARQWSNAVLDLKGASGKLSILASASVADPNPGSIGYFYTAAGLGAAPRAAVGLIVKGTYQSGDLNIDLGTVEWLSSRLPTGDLTGMPGAYNPGYYPASGTPIPGTGMLRGVRPDNKTLTGFYHATRQVPFLLVLPAAPAPAGGYPVLIYQHGITSQKENILAAANTICAAGYAVVAIDAPLHGEVSNGRPASEWGANFMSLLSILNTRTNVQQGGFNLWRLERILKQPATDASSLQAAAAALGKPLAATGASKFLGHSLGTILGSYFLAGNSAQTQGSNISAFFSAPGARSAYIIRDSPAGFAKEAKAALAAGGLATDSHAYNQYFLLVQTLTDPVDPSWALSPMGAQANGLPLPSRLAGRLVVQEAIGDATIPNKQGRHFANALGGWGALGGSPFDIAPGFTQVTYAGATAPTVPFMLAAGGLKAAKAPALSPGDGPTEGHFQFGSPSAAASHSMLLDFANPGITVAAQKQLFIWLTTGRLADPTDAAHWPGSPEPLMAEEPLQVMPLQPKSF